MVSQAVKNPTKTMIRAAVGRTARFMERNSSELTKFFTSLDKYRVVGIRLMKHSDTGIGDFEIEISVYEEDKTHFYLESLTADELKKKIKELEEHKR